MNLYLTNNLVYEIAFKVVIPVTTAFHGREHCDATTKLMTVKKLLEAAIHVVTYFSDSSRCGRTKER